MGTAAESWDIPSVVEGTSGATKPHAGDWRLPSILVSLLAK